MSLVKMGIVETAMPPRAEPEGYVCPQGPTVAANSDDGKGSGIGTGIGAMHLCLTQYLDEGARVTISVSWMQKGGGIK